MSDLPKVLSRLQELGKTRRTERGLLSTGIESLDSLLGGGMPRGELIQIYGPSGSGKSATTGLILGHVGDNDLGLCALIDADHTAESCVAFYGPLGDLQESVLIHEPRSALEAVQVSQALVGAVDLLVVDSLGAFEENALAVTRELAAAASRTGCIVIVTNQIRVSIHHRRNVSFGGHGPRYYSGTIIRLEAAPLRSKGERIGVTISGFLEKHRSIDPAKPKKASWDLEHLHT